MSSILKILKIFATSDFWEKQLFQKKKKKNVDSTYIFVYNNSDSEVRSSRRIKLDT